MADDYSLASKPRLFKLANDENPGALLSDSTVTLGAPAPTTLNDKNTVVQFTGITGSIRFGSRPYYYDRLDLALFFQDELDMDPGPLLITINDYTTVYDLLPRLRAMYNIGIAEDDVVNELVVGTSHVMKAKDDSFGWIGQVTLDIQPLLTQLSTVLTVLTLPLFNPTIFGTPSVDQLLARINLANTTDLTFDDVEFAGFTPPAGGNNNTADRIVTVQGRSGALLTGTVEIRYTRRNGIDIYPNPLPVSYDFELVEDKDDLMSLLRDYDNLILDGEEVARTTVGADPDVEKLTANGYSVLWTNGSNFLFDAPKIPLAQAAFNKTWAGLFSSDIPSIYVQPADVMDAMVDANTNLVDDNHPIRYGVTGDVISTDHFLLNRATLATFMGDGNTSVTLTATANNPRYTGSATILYDRVIAEEAFTDPVDLTSAGTIMGTTTRAVLTALNNLIHTGIEPSWVQDDPVEADAMNIALVFIEGQFLFQLGTTLNIVVTRPGEETEYESNFFLDDTDYHMLDDGSVFWIDDNPDASGPGEEESNFELDGGFEFELDDGSIFDLDSPT